MNHGVALAWSSTLNLIREIASQEQILRDDVELTLLELVRVDLDYAVLLEVVRDVDNKLRIVNHSWIVHKCLLRLDRILKDVFLLANILYLRQFLKRYFDRD